MPTRNALITGAASGIGAGVTQAFAANGFGVALFDINGPGLERMRQVLGSDGSVLTITGDVSIEKDAERAVNETVSKLGSIDVLINNAGIEIAGTAVSLSSQEWDRLLGINLKGAFLFSKFAIPAMKPGSAVVNISSVHAFVAYGECVAYDASKAGLLGLTRAMALDHGPAGIRINAICPGYIDTPLLESWLSTLEDREATLDQLKSVHPVRRIGTPEDIANAALFLASEQAAFITGAHLVVDGGMTLAGK
jgi:NAD(P)-dependent dehydrogenase (short-subunit alcohol dehydrogenase family)